MRPLLPCEAALLGPRQLPPVDPDRLGARTLHALHVAAVARRRPDLVRPGSVYARVAADLALIAQTPARSDRSAA